MDRKLKLLCGVTLFLTMVTLFVGMLSSSNRVYATRPGYKGGTSSTTTAKDDDDGKEKPKHEHWSYVQSRKAATCTEDGYIKYVGCGCTNYESWTQTIPKLGHALEWKSNNAEGYNEDGNKHWEECTREGCNYKQSEEPHSYTNHACKCKTTYQFGQQHRFDEYGGTCVAKGAGCEKQLTASVSKEGGPFPHVHEYTMTDAKEQFDHEALGKVTVNFDTMPNVSIDGGESYLSPSAAGVEVFYTWTPFTHGSYNDHLAKAKSSFRNDSDANGDGILTSSEYGQIIDKNNKWAPKIKDLTFGRWKDDEWVQAHGLTNSWDGVPYQMFLANGKGEKRKAVEGLTTVIDAPGSVGHGIYIGCYVNLNGKDGKIEQKTGVDEMFCNGGCGSSPVNIYGYLRVCYRTEEGYTFDGLDDYIIQESVCYRNPIDPTITVNVQNAIPDIAGYRFVGYIIEDDQLGPAGALNGRTTQWIDKSENPSVGVPLRFTETQINRRITFYYEKVNLTVRHYNMTDGTKLANGLRQITTSGNITKKVTFNNDRPGNVPRHTTWPDYETNSLSKFWWPAYNLEYTTVLTNDNPDLNSEGTFRTVEFSPYKAFAPKVTDATRCTEIVQSSSSIRDAINQIYGINNSNLNIDVLDRMVNDNSRVEQAKSNLKNAANILVYGRESSAGLREDKTKSNFKDLTSLKLVTTKLVTVIEDILLSNEDKVNQIKKTVTVPYAPNNSAINEYTGYRSDKWINYYYTTTEIMVNNINAETGAYMQTWPDTNGTTYNLRTKVPIRDTIFRAESLITTPPAFDDQKYTYSVYDPDANTYTRRDYNITGYILEKFDIKVGDEVLLTVTKEDAEGLYKIDGTDTELYPPFTDQYIIDTAATDGVAALVSGAISQIDLARLDKDASVNFYYRDVSLLKIKYIRDTDQAEIYPGKTIILGPDPIDVNPENLEPEYEYKEYILDGEYGTNPPVSVPELPNGQDRELIFVYRVPELEVATPEEDKHYVDLRSNDRVSANQIQQAMYPDAPKRLDENGYYSDTYKSAEEYNSYNDRERKADQSNEGIPTIEDIYANVMSEQFLMDNALTIQPTTQKIKLWIVKKYYDTNRQDDKTTNRNDPESAIGDQVKIFTVELDEMEVPYQYYGASGADLKIIEDAIVYNNVIIEQGVGVNQTTLEPTYQKPNMNYTKNGYLHLPVERNYENAIAGLTDYRKLASGFYNVTNPTKRGETLQAVLVLDGIDEYEPTTAKLKREYQDAYGLILTQLQNAGTLVKPDRLTVTYNASANGQDSAYIREFLVVTDDFNLTSAGKVDINNNMRLGRTYTADVLERMGILHTDDIPMIGTDVLYKKDNLYVETKTTNGTHGVSQIPKFNGTGYENNTVAEVKYILYQTIHEEEVVGGPAPRSLQEALGAEYQTRYDEAVRIQTILGYPVVVHTPVVNASTFNLGGTANDYSAANLHAVNPSAVQGTHGTLVLGERFDISIPHKGQHINSVGYGNNTYNYKGLLANGAKSSKDNALYNATYDKNFAIIKQIRFDKVGVILYIKNESGISGGTYYPKNTWIDLPLEEETYTFTIPEWEEEIWDGTNRQVKIETRVAAENIPDYENTAYYEYTTNTKTTDLSYNHNKPKYGVWKTFYFKAIPA